MTKRKILSAKKYEVILNTHLVNEILDQMRLNPSQRGVIVRGLGSINIALNRAKFHPEDFPRSELSLVAVKSRGSHRHITLADLALILDDDCSVQFVHTDGNCFDNPMFGEATQQAVNEFVDAAIAAVDHGLFRP